ncbi:PEP-CTERM sorting domain-containing protein [Zooshikella sp. RANM57]|uniref:PEP-CTERM sorting domain-containing protein n=1 Tax=Zooshikella sp. RANM57 TaxID=3425863 RepID=UPI003D701376
MISLKKGRKFCFAGLVTLLTTNVMAGAVDLSSWVVNNHPGPGGSNWVVSGADNDTVLQTTNGNPTVFFDPTGNAQGTSLSGQITVETTGDDDFIGFVLGYDPDEINSAVSDFILVDWKQGNQGSFGGTAFEGLAISHVTMPGVGPFWGHDTVPSGVSEIARATNLGSTGWADNQTYTFDIIFTSSLIEVLVDDVLEFSITPGDAGLTEFDNGSFGFYNYSQGNVRYAGITEDVVPDPDPDPTPVPVPSTLAIFLLGLFGAGLARRSK